MADVKKEYTVYEEYYNEAKKSLKNNQFELSRKCFLLAAKQMYKIAKTSPYPEQQKQTRLADSIMKMVDELSTKVKKQLNETQAYTQFKEINDKKKVDSKSTPFKVITIKKHSKQIDLIHGGTVEILFTLSDDSIDSKIYLRWNKKQYVCSKILSDWKVEVKDIISPGKYKFEILYKEKIISCIDVVISMGYTENDLGL